MKAKARSVLTSDAAIGIRHLFASEDSRDMRRKMIIKPLRSSYACAFADVAIASGGGMLA